jgi:hypothetical protein
MDDEQFVKRLEDLGLSTTIGQLRRDAAQGLIPTPPIRYQRRRKRAGRPPNSVKAAKEGRIVQKAHLGRLPRDWPEEALEEAAAVWAVRKRYRSGDWREKQLSNDQIDVIRKAAHFVDTNPVTLFDLPIVVGPLFGQQRIPTREIRMRHVPLKFEGADLFPGGADEKKAGVLNDLVVAWIATIEKVRHTTAMEEKYTNVALKVPEEFPFVWRVDRPASVLYQWWWNPEHGGKTSDGKLIGKGRGRCSGVMLGTADKDEIVMLENGVDPRKLFTIGFDADPARVAKLLRRELDEYYKSAPRFEFRVENGEIKKSKR